MGTLLILFATIAPFHQEIQTSIRNQVSTLHYRMTRPRASTGYNNPLITRARADWENGRFFREYMPPVATEQPMQHEHRIQRPREDYTI